MTIHVLLEFEDAVVAPLLLSAWLLAPRRRLPTSNQIWLKFLTVGMWLRLTSDVLARYARPDIADGAKWMVAIYFIATGIGSANYLVGLRRKDRGAMLEEELNSAIPPL